MESRRPDAVLRDPRAEEMVAAIDYDFARFDGVPSLTGTVLRTALFDHWVREYPHRRQMTAATNMPPAMP